MMQTAGERTVAATVWGGMGSGRGDGVVGGRVSERRVKEGSVVGEEKTTGAVDG